MNQAIHIPTQAEAQTMVTQAEITVAAAVIAALRTEEGVTKVLTVIKHRII